MGLCGSGMRPEAISHQGSTVPGSYSASHLYGYSASHLCSSLSLFALLPLMSAFSAAFVHIFVCLCTFAGTSLPLLTWLSISGTSPITCVLTLHSWDRLVIDSSQPLESLTRCKAHVSPFSEASAEMFLEKLETSQLPTSPGVALQTRLADGRGDPLCRGPGT